MTDADEPTDPDPAFDLQGLPEFPAEDDAPEPPEGWLSALGQMGAALLVVLAIIALFVGMAVVVRWVLP